MKRFIFLVLFFTAFNVFSAGQKDMDNELKEIKELSTDLKSFKTGKFSPRKFLPKDNNLTISNGIFYGTFKDQNGKTWAVIGIANMSGKKELISIELRYNMKKKKFIPDTGNIYLFASHLKNMKMNLKKRQELIMLLHSPEALKAGTIFEKNTSKIKTKYDSNTMIILSEMAKALRFIQSLTKPRFNNILTPKYLKTTYKKLGFPDSSIKLFASRFGKNPMIFLTPVVRSGTTDCETNGCSYSPDGNWKHCCDEHDICYCKGGTEIDRYKCDLALKECIASSGFIGSLLADTYFWAVRIFASSHFNYAEAAPAAEDTPTTPPDPGKMNCRAKVWLDDVIYNGDDIGNDIEYDYCVNVVPLETAGTAVSGVYHQGETEFNQGTSKTPNTLVLDTLFSGMAGQKFRFDVQVWAKEHDAGPDDYSATSFSIELRPDIVSPQNVTVNITECAEGTASFVFNFRCSLTNE